MTDGIQSAVVDPTNQSSSESPGPTIPGMTWAAMGSAPAQRAWSWLGKMRLRVAILIVGIPLAAAGLIAMTPAWAALPVVGVAFAAVMTSMSKMTLRLNERTCLSCGADLRDEPVGDHGIICPACGALRDSAPFGPDAHA